MKKISLKSIKSEELLSREELKQIMGGNGGSDGQNYECVDIEGGKYPCTEYPEGPTCTEMAAEKGIEVVGCYYAI